jgi:hypothetical protein
MNTAPTLPKGGTVASDQWQRCEDEFRKCDDLFNEVSRAADMVEGVNTNEARGHLHEARKHFAIAGFWLGKAIHSVKGTP